MPRPCPVCQHESATLLAEGLDFEYGTLPGPFQVFRCERCGHGYLDPLPRPDQLATIYPPTYYTVNERSPIHFDGFIYETKLRRDVDRILSLVGDRPVRSVVDLGCGDAQRLEALADRLGEGVTCTGVDFQPDAERARELAARGIAIVEADIEAGLDELEDGAHDLIIMCQLIEHLRDPAGAVRSLARKLAPGGLLLAETPNLGGLDYRLFRPRHWGGYHFPRHFHFFTPDTLRACMEQGGLAAAGHGFLPSGFLIVSLRNWLGLSSIERGRRFGEFIHMRNLFVVGCVTAFELVRMALGGQTSNQYMLAEKP